MRPLIYVICMVFTFVSIGGNVYIHQCQEATLLSFYEKVGISNCPFCEKHHHEEQEKDVHCQGDCKDAVLEIDQLSHTDLNTQQAFFTTIYPAIIQLLWINNFIQPLDNAAIQQSQEFLYSFSDSSPPIYLLNNIFRI